MFFCAYYLSTNAQRLKNINNHFGVTFAYGIAVVIYMATVFAFAVSYPRLKAGILMGIQQVYRRIIWVVTLYTIFDNPRSTCYMDNKDASAPQVDRFVWSVHLFMPCTARRNADIAIITL